MFIKEISLHNFRIYKESHKLFLKSDSRKNVFVISGNNGYGKTTLLTSLVWCLYGKQMKDVDEVYRNQINEVGGYSKFIQSCMNRLSKREGQNNFEVSIAFSDVNIPSIPCNDIRVNRKGYYDKGSDEVSIEIDGKENELTREVGDEIFVHDFILPKEVAKFFFFDSEKIVSLAEMKSISDKRQLSKAYSEVLGIKKYDDLRKNLYDLTLRFKKGSASPNDLKEFEKLIEEKNYLENNKVDLKIKLESLFEEKKALQDASNELQEKLIRKGSNLSVDEINNLKIKKYTTSKVIENLKADFRELLDLAPFAIAGELFADVKDQLEKEEVKKKVSLNQEVLDRKKKDLKDAILSIDPKSEHIRVTNKADSFYKNQLVSLLDEILLIPEDNKLDGLKVLHSFSEDEYNSFHSIYNQLQTSFSNRLKSISKALKNKRLEYGRTSRKLSNAEMKASDGVIEKYRKDKLEADDKIIDIDEEIIKINQRIGSITNEIDKKNSVIEDLAKKIKVHERYEKKDLLAKKLISELEDFLVRIKEEKKTSLEDKILKSLNSLMHKKNFINKVSVEVTDDLIDINLFNSSGEEIGKDTLSKGEQQLYATALLKALVDESNIEFPVFIDSPLQKFDSEHAKNIIAEFYPNVSKQVVLLPLLNKEMTMEEYSLLEDKVKSAYLIHNEHEELSSLIEVDSNRLFEAAAKLQSHVY